MGLRTLMLLVEHFLLLLLLVRNRAHRCHSSPGRTYNISATFVIQALEYRCRTVLTGPRSPQVYATNPDLGSISVVYQRLRAVEAKHPVADNMGGSYVTMFSKSGVIFGIINIIGGWFPAA